MKKLMLTVCLVLGLLIMIAQEVPALTVYIDRISGYYTGSGGEFNIVPSSWAGIGGYNAKALVGNGFETFCVEKQEFVALPGTYDAVISNYAVLGKYPSPGDPISVGTAYLYHQFQIGELAGYNYTPGAGRQTYAGKLQDAFWMLEEEMTWVASNEFIALLLTIPDYNTQAKAMADNNGGIPVGALNLYYQDANHTLAQDQLVCVPVPEPGILILLGIAMSAIGAASWRIRKL